MKDPVTLKASLYKINTADKGHFVSFKIPFGQKHELKELELRKGQRLLLIAVTEEEFEHITGERH